MLIKIPAVFTRYTAVSPSLFLGCIYWFVFDGPMAILALQTVVSQHHNNLIFFIKSADYCDQTFKLDKSGKSFQEELGHKEILAMRV